MSKKKPRLFYFEEACGAWIQAPERVESILDAESHFAGPEDSEVEIRFKRIDLTDKELADLPEAG